MSSVQPVITQITDGEEHTLQACSLLLIPPPPPGARVQIRSIPMNLINLAAPDWAKVVQDLASHMMTLPIGFSVSDATVASLLKHLERATGQPACKDCHYPKKRCLCAMGQASGSYSGWSGGPMGASGVTVTPPTGTTSTLSVAQRRAPTSTMGAPSQGAPNPAPGLLQARFPTPVQSVVGMSNYAAGPPMHQGHMTSQNTLGACQRLTTEPPTLEALIRQQQVHVPPIIGHGRGVGGQTVPPWLPTPGVSGGNTLQSVGKGCGVLSLGKPSILSNPTDAVVVAILARPAHTSPLQMLSRSLSQF